MAKVLIYIRVQSLEDFIEKFRRAAAHFQLRITISYFKDNIILVNIPPILSIPIECFPGMLFVCEDRDNFYCTWEV